MMEEKKKRTTLCYLEKDDAYLMLHRVKKEKDENAGKWIGIGGKFEDFETPEDCLLREVKEETGLTLTEYRARGLVTFISDIYGTEYMYLYTATGFTGEMTECSEGVLSWVAKKDVLSLNLWEGDREFFKLLYEDAPYFRMTLRYEGDSLKETSVEYGEADK